MWRDGKQIHLGYFATAEEAALHVARTPEGQAAAQAAAALPPPMTAEEALAQAEAEGLTLARSDNQSGFRHVSVHPEDKARPYTASVWRDGKNVHLGSFATAEEAALHVARTPEAQAAAALPPPMTAERRWQARRRGWRWSAAPLARAVFATWSVHPEYKARPYAASVVARRQENPPRLLRHGRGGGAARRQNARGTGCRSPATADDSGRGAGAGGGGGADAGAL